MAVSDLLKGSRSKVIERFHSRCKRRADLDNFKDALTGIVEQTFRSDTSPAQKSIWIRTSRLRAYRTHPLSAFVQQAQPIIPTHRQPDHAFPDMDVGDALSFTLLADAIRVRVPSVFRPDGDEAQDHKADQRRKELGA